MVNGIHRGTVVGQGSNFKVEDAILKLHSAMDRIGTSENMIIEVISSHNNKELQEIKKVYKEAYKRELGQDFSDELSENFKKLCLYLLLPRPHFLAFSISRAIKGKDTSFSGVKVTTLIEILCTKSRQEVMDISSAYLERFNRDMRADIVSATTGGLRELMSAIIEFGRDTTSDPKLILTDVQNLLEAGPKLVPGVKTEVFITILARRSIVHLQKMFAEYKHHVTGGIQSTIKSEISGHLQTALLAIVRYAEEPLDLFAECFYESIKGIGTDDQRLMQLTIDRCEGEIDLLDVALTYAQKYGKPLSKAIADDTCGDYERLLVELTLVRATGTPQIEAKEVAEVVVPPKETLNTPIKVVEKTVEVATETLVPEETTSTPIRLVAVDAGGITTEDSLSAGR